MWTVGLQLSVGLVVRDETLLVGNMRILSGTVRKVALVEQEGLTGQRVCEYPKDALAFASPLSPVFDN